MTGYPGTCVGRPVPADAEVELHLLLPARQFAALEQMAGRSQLTVTALLRRAVGELLRPAGGATGAGEVPNITVETTP